MPADPVLTRELQSLHEEISASRRARAASLPSGEPRADEGSAAGPGAAAPAPTPDEAADERLLRDEVHAFLDEVTQIFKDAEKNVSAHPTASVMGALVLGILIGRLLGRR
ncbi:MAG TPA: hypothetical protein VNR11_02920 [Xanthobacteraceae bacterium]|nr:hypothetical protein [Xanthobacteraceae bacterium]